MLEATGTGGDESLREAHSGGRVARRTRGGALPRLSEQLPMIEATVVEQQSGSHGPRRGLRIYYEATLRERPGAVLGAQGLPLGYEMFMERARVLGGRTTAEIFGWIAGGLVVVKWGVALNLAVTLTVLLLVVPIWARVP